MFYIEKDNEIILFDTNRYQLENTLLLKPELKNLEIKEVQEGYVIVDFELLTVEEAEQREAQKERERIANLTCTKRVFALMLQKLGISYTQLKELIATNEQAQLEWELCVELERSNPLLDVMAKELEITPETLDRMFLYANNEIDSLNEDEENA